MTRHDAAHERVTLPENPLEESDECAAFTSGDATARIPTVPAARRLDWSKTSASTRRAITDDRKRGNPNSTIP